MEEQKTSLGSMIFTIAFVAFVFLMTVGAFVFLYVSKDFIEPVTFSIDNECYGYTMDEFAEFLQENGYISTTDYTRTTVSENSVTEARQYGDVLVLWWDTENMDKEGEAYARWKTLSNVGNLFLEDSRVMVYGPYGVSYLAPAEGQPERYEILQNFPAEYSGNHGNVTVWDMTMGDLLSYFVECGFMTKEEILTMAPVGTLNYIGNSIDMAWWDVDNLVEGTEEYEYWYSMQNDGYIYLYGASIYVPVMNGPFGICVNAPSTAKAEDVVEAFNNFPMNYSGNNIFPDIR